MKKLFLPMLMLAVWAAAVLTTMAVASEEEETFFYGDYAYTLADGQATIEWVSGGQCGPSWDDEEDGFERPGMEDESARLPKSDDDDGVLRIVVPDSLDGHPVVAIGECGLAEGVWGDVILPEGLLRIEASAFSGCIGADAITIPPSVTWIGEYAFESCAATLRVTEGSYAARYAQENDIPYTYDMTYTVFQSDGWLYTLTDGVATICGYERYDEYDGEGKAIAIDLVFPSRLGGYPVTPVERLPLRRFDAYINLASITIPTSVTEITGYPFQISFIPHVAQIARIFVSPGNPAFDDMDGVLFDKQRKTLLVCPSERTGHYAIPEGVTAIGDHAFDECYRLTSVSIPDSVTHIGAEAFNECGFTSVIIPGSVTSIGDYAFNACFDLTHVSIPASVTSIGSHAFDDMSGTLSVPEGSYAEQYAMENKIAYEYTEAEAKK